MAKDRKGIIRGELAALALILACLAGVLASVVATYRRVNLASRAPAQVAPVLAAPAPPPRTEVAAPVAVAPPPRPKRLKTPAPTLPAPAPEDPTVPAVARLTAAEAEQLLAASQSNRRAQALEDATRAAEAESERMRRRKSLIHAQIDSIEGRVRKAEVELDALALERDALEKERDARKAAIARARSRPGQAILPHKGPNGTWRRPIVVECRNGAAVIQPRGLEFGLLELEADLFGMANPFVSAVAREAARAQTGPTPDGAPAVPYVFFLVRPDGIRPYYEARGRLESLGVAFGYELADQDWAVEIPDLDNVAAWDGSAPGGPAPDRLAQAGSAEDVDLPSWPKARGDATRPADPFNLDAPARGFGGLGTGGSGWSRLADAGRNPRRLGAGPGVSPAGPTPGASPGGSSPGLIARGETTTPATGPIGIGRDWRATSGAGPAPIPGLGMASAPPAAIGAPPRNEPNGQPGGGGLPPGPLLADVGTVGPASPTGGDGRPAASTPPGMSPAPAPGLDVPTIGSTDPTASDTGPALVPPSSGQTTPDAGPALDAPTAGPTAPSPRVDPADPTDPASSFVFRGQPGQGQGRPASPPAADPLNLGSDDVASPGPDPSDSAQGGSVETGGNPGAGGGSQAARRQLGAAAPTGATSAANQPGSPAPPVGLGLPGSAPPIASPPSRPLPSPSSLPDLSKVDLSKLDPSKLPDLAKLPPVPPIPLPMKLPIPRHLPTPREAGAAVERQLRPDAPSPPPPAAPVDRTFEIVVVCSPDGVIVQPGHYRITPDALANQEGLLKRQMVGLVKARRASDPTNPVEPKVRFLIQPRGVDTYRAARSQYFVSGLNWPTTTQIADPDPLVIRTRGVW